MTEALRNMTSLYLTRGGRILMLHRAGGRVAAGKWVGSAGGHFEKQELNDPRACILRELYEELGLTESELSHLTLRYITLRSTGTEIRQNYYFFAELKEDVAPPLTSNEGTLAWLDPEHLPDLPMPVTASFMIRHYLNEGRYTNALYAGIFDGQTVCFHKMEE